MTYTFLSRRRLNEQLRQTLPNIPWDEDKGNCTPRMRTPILPEGSDIIVSYEALESLSAAYYLLHRNPMPVYLQVPGGYEVNYVHPHSQPSLNEAWRWGEKHRLYH